LTLEPRAKTKDKRQKIKDKDKDKDKDKRRKKIDAIHATVSSCNLKISD